jgi:hypothetical protein
VACNPACLDLFAVGRDDEIGRAWQWAPDTGERAGLEGALRDVLASRRPLTVEQHLVDHDGVARVARWGLTPFDIGGGPARALAVSARDDEHSVMAREQAALFRVAMAIAGEANPVSVFHLVSEEAARLLGADIGSLARFESETELVNLAAWAEVEIQGMPPYGARQPIMGAVPPEQPRGCQWVSRHR